MIEREKIVTGIIFDIDHFAVHDGPGIRTTVYFKGCPLKCVWCHSPESQKTSPEILFIPGKCIMCGNCISVCERDLQKIEGQKRIFQREKCSVCGDCVTACPTEALRFSGKEMTVDSVVAEVKENFLFFKNSGGGVTLTGGEVLCQPEFALAILKKVKMTGIHAIVETSGMGKKEDLLALIPHVDVFYYDLKILDEQKHLKYTGCTNQVILANLISLRQKTESIVIRIPLIPGYTDSLDNISDIYRFLKKQKIKRVDLLPYNSSAPAKYKWLKRKYLPGKLDVQTDDYLQELQEKAPQGIEVRIIN